MSGSKSSNPGVANPAPADATADALAFTVHSMPVPAAVQQRTTSGRLKMLLIGLACAAPVVASYLTYYVIRPEGRSNYSTLIDPVRALPSALPLQSIDGTPVAAASLRGQWLLVAVAGGCDAVCEKRLYMQRQLREMLGRERDRVEKIWFVVDDAPVSAELAAALASAEPVRVLRVPRAELAKWLEPEAGQALEAHLYLIDPLGQWVLRPPADPQPAKVKRDLDRLLRASASWDKAGR
jgi:hypothetical protein